MKVGYARVSTTEQTTEHQVTQLINAGIPHHQIYTDDGVSGMKEPSKRPGYRRLMKVIETGEVTDLYVYEVSRLGRDTRSTLEELIRLEKGGITVHSLSQSESILEDVQNPALRPLLISVFQLAADLERQHISERTRVGLETARARGKVLGRRRVEVDWECIKRWMDKGLSERAAVKVCGYAETTFYRRKKERVDK